MHVATESRALEERLDFLRGRIVISRGSIFDYRALSHLHYVEGDPATCAGVWRAEFEDLQFVISDLRFKDSHRKPAVADRKLIGVVVLSYPTPSLRARDRTFLLSGPRYGAKLRWINAHVRTISRVIVHPQFRALGIASSLVRRVLLDCPVRYVESVAAMGVVHPFFVRAGMIYVEPMHQGESAYFWFDREAGQC
jgi:hypothetical protein